MENASYSATESEEQTGSQYREEKDCNESSYGLEHIHYYLLDEFEKHIVSPELKIVKNLLGVKGRNTIREHFLHGNHFLGHERLVRFHLPGDILFDCRGELEKGLLIDRGILLLVIGEDATDPGKQIVAFIEGQPFGKDVLERAVIPEGVHAGIHILITKSRLASEILDKVAIDTDAYRTVRLSSLAKAPESSLEGSALVAFCDELESGAVLVGFVLHSVSDYRLEATPA
jgi:hypothetical protein